MRRELVEFHGKSGAGILEETDDYYLVRVMNDFNMYVHKQDQSVTPCLVRDGYWESWITSYFLSRLGPATVFYDVGANAGYYAFMAATRGALVQAFEPNPVYFKMLEATKEYNKFGRTLHLSNWAVSDKKGTATLNIPKSLHGSASLHELDPQWESTPVEVETRPLDHLNGCGSYLIKIDAEGHEEQVWDGMIDSLNRRAGSNEVILEYTPGMYSDEFLDKLEDFAPLAWINHSGEAEPVTRDWLLNGADWAMLTLKPSRRRM